jgi:phenylpropionate dioxygenase-like ring-hydroxylating dioxygenase large terminal subunit
MMSPACTLSQYPTGWWIIASSGEVLKSKPTSLKRFNTDIVLWRSESGELHALKDLCPHRSVKLSLGQIKDGGLACPFHGLTFSPEGNCIYVPEVKRDAPQIKVGCFNVKEAHGYIWLFWDPKNKFTGPLPEIEWFNELPAHACIYDQTATTTSHVTRAIENQLDFNHLSFVHRNSIGKGSDPTKMPQFKFENSHIQFFMSGAELKTPYISFKMPNLWLNAISPRFMLTLGFVPVDDRTTQFYMRTYQNFFTLPVVAPLLMKLSGLLNNRILQEDLNVITSHPAGSSLETGVHENLLASDKAIRHFRELWKNSIL